MSLSVQLILALIFYCVFVALIEVFRRTSPPPKLDHFLHQLRHAKLPWIQFVVVVLLAHVLIRVIPANPEHGSSSLDLLLASFALLAPLLSVATLVSCLRSNQPVMSKVFWVGVSFLAPVFGPILWFAWGKSRISE